MALKDANGIALGDVTATAGGVTVTTVDGDVTVNAGATVSATAAGDAAANVTFTAGSTGKKILVNGTVDAKTTATLNSDAEVSSDGVLTAAAIAGGKGLTTAGTVTADTISADVTQTAGTIDRKGTDTTLTFKGTVSQSGGVIGDATTPYAVTMQESFTQSGGTLAAERLNLQGGANQTGGKVEAGNLVLSMAGQDVALGGNENKIGSVRGTVRDLTLKDSDGGLVIANDVSDQGLNIGGTGSITTSGDLTQEGQLVATGEFTANAANVNLSHQWNRFKGGVNATATANGGYVRLAHRGDILGSETVNIKSVQAGTSAARGDVRIEAVVGGGISVSGAVDGKNVTLSAEKNIAENAAVSATVDKYVHTTAGNIDVNVAGTVGHSVAYVAEASTAKVNTGTDVTIRAGENGNSFIQTGDNKVVVSGSGSVASKDGVTTFTDASVVAINTTDSVVVNNAGKPVEVGTIGGEAGAVNITEVLADPAGGTAQNGTEAVALVGSGSGDAVSGITAKDVSINVTGDPGETAVTVSKAITATDGSVAVVAAKGAVDVAANITGKTGVTLTATDGDVTIGTDTAAGVVVKVGVFADEATGTVATGSSANLEISAGNGVTVQNGATVAATGDAQVTANGANGITVTDSGTKLVADKSLTVKTTAENGNVAISGGAYVAARNSADGNETKVTSENGAVMVSGAATAVEAGKNLTLAGKTGVTVDAAKAGADGALKLEATGDDASVAVQNGARAYGKDGVTLDAKKDVTIDGSGTLVKAGTFTVDEATGEVTGADAGKKLAVTAGNAVKVTNGAKAGASGEVDVDAGAGGVEVSGASALASKGTMNIDADGGEVKVEGNSKVASASTLDIGASGNTKGVTVGTETGDDVSQVVSADNLTVQAQENITVQNKVKVASDKALTLTTTTTDGSIAVQGGAGAYGKTGVKLDSKKDVTITGSGTLVKAGSFSVDGQGNFTSLGGKVEVRGGANVGASGAADIDAGADGVKVTGTGTKLVSNGAMTIDANGGTVEVTDSAYVGGNTTVKVGEDGATASAKVDNAQLVARDAVVVTTTGNIDVQNNAKVASDTTLTLTTTTADGSIAVKGGASAYGKTGVTLDSKKDVTITGSGTLVKAGSFSVDGQGNFTSLGAAGKVEVSGGANVGASGTVDIDAGASGVTVAGTDTKLVSNGAMTIDANGGAVNVENGAYVGGSATVTVGGDATKSTASAKVDNAQLVAKEAVAVTTTGNIDVQNNAKVASDTTLTLTTTGADGSIAVKGGAGAYGKTGVTLDSAKDVTITGNGTIVKAGSFSVDEHGAVAMNGAAANMTVTAAGKVDMNNGANVGASGTATVTANGADGVTVTGNGTKLVSEDTMNITANNAGGVTVGGKAYVGTHGEAHLAASGDVDINTDGTKVESAKAMTLSGANVKVNAARVGTSETLGVTATTGDVTVENSATVIAKNDITVTATGDTTATPATGGNVTVDDSSVTSTAGSIDVGTSTARIGGTFTAKNDATVTAASDVKVYAAGDAKVLGTSKVEAKNGDATIDAQGDIKVAGLVSAKNKATLTAQETITDDDTVISHGDAATAPWAVEATAHSAHVVAKDAVLSAKSIGDATKPVDIEVETLDATATAGSAYLWEKDGIEVKKLSATQNAEVENLSGDVTLSGAAKAENGNLLVGAKSGSISLEDSVTAVNGAASILATGTIAQKADVSAKTLDVEAFGSGNEIIVDANTTAAATDTLRLKAETIQNNGTVEAPTGTGIFEGNLKNNGGINVKNIAIGGSLEGGVGTLAAETFVFDGDHVGTETTAVSINAKTIAVRATGGVFLSNGRDATIGSGTTASGGSGIVRVHLDGTTTQVGGGTSGGSGTVTGVTSQNDNVSIENSGTLTVDADVSGDKGVTLNAKVNDPDKGDIIIKADKTVKSDNGDVRLTADNNVDVNGGTVVAGVFTDATRGAVAEGSSRNVKIEAGNGVTIQNGATVAATGNAQVTAKGAGGVTVTGQNAAGKSTQLVADKGMTVEATATDGSYVLIKDGAYVGARNNDLANGDATETKITSIAGSVKVTDERDPIGNNNTTVGAGGDLTISGKTGVTVEKLSKVASDKILTLNTTDPTGSIIVQGGAGAYGKTGVELKSENSDVKVSGNGTLVKAGSFTVDPETGLISPIAGNDDSAMNATLKVTAGKSVMIDGGANVGASGTATVTANGADADGNAVVVTGDGTKLVSEGNMTFAANGGNMSVDNKAYVGTHGTLGATATGDLFVKDTGTNVESAKAMTLSGANVKVEAARVGTSETLGVTATTGNVEVENKATVIAKNDITVTATGDTTVTPVTGGNVTIKDSSVTSTAGSINVGTPAAPIGGTFKAQDDATVEATAGNVKVYATGDAKVLDTSRVAAGGGDATVDAGKSISVDGEVVASVNATLTAVDDITISDGIDTTKGLVQAQAGKVEISAGVGGTTASVTVKEDATVSAGTTVGVTAGKDVKILDTADVLAKGTGVASSDTTLKIEAQNGEILVDGNGTGPATVKAGDFEYTMVGGSPVLTPGTLGDAKKAHLTAGTTVTVQKNAGVGASGDVDIDAGGAAVVTDSAIVFGNGNVTVDATDGRIDVVKNAGVFSGSGTVTLTAGGTSGAITVKDNATVDGALDVRLDADTFITLGQTTGSKYAKVEGGNVTLEADESVTVTGESKVIADNAVTINSTDTTGTATDIMIDTTSVVQANDGSVTLNNANGAVKIQNATVEAKGTNGSVDIAATGAVTIGGDGQSRNAVVMGDKDVLVESSADGVSVKDATVTAGEDLRLGAAVGNTDTGVNGNVMVDTGVTMTAGQNATIEAKGGVTLNSDVTARAGDAVVMANGGTVNMAQDTTLTAGRHAAIEATEGVALSKVNASTDNGTVAVRTTGGNITDVYDNENANVMAKNAVFSAAGGAVGASDNHVDTAVGSVAATARDGVFLTEGDGVTVDLVASVPANKVKADGTTESHDTADASGLTIADGGNGAVVLEATAGDVNVAQAVEAKGANGNILVAANAAGGSVTVGAAVTAAQNAAIIAGGKIDQNAGGNITARSGDAWVEAQGGSVTMAGETATTVGRNAYVAATGTSGDVSISKVESTATTDGAVSVKANGGSILDATGNEAPNILAQKVRLEAGTSVGGAGDADIETKAENVEVNAANGSVFLHNTQAVTVGGVGDVSVKKVDAGTAIATDTAAGSDMMKNGVATGATASGDIRIEANGDMSVIEAVATTARPTGADADKTGNIRLEAASGNLSVNEAVSGNNVTLASSGNAEVAAGNKVDAAKDLYVTAGGNIDLNANAGEKSAVAGETMALVSGGKINASGLKTSVLFTSGASDITINGAEVSKQAKGSSGGNIDAEFKGDATIAYNAVGHVKVAADGALTVDSASGTDGSISVTEVVDIGNVTAANNGVEEIVLVSADGGAGAIVGVTSDSSYASLKGASVTVNKAVAANGDNVVLESTTGGVELNAGVTARQDATVLAKTSVNQNVGGNITARAGDAYVEAQGGDVTMANGTTTTAGNNARIAASGNVRLSAVNAANSASVKATAGFITDNTTAEAANVTAQKLRLEAGTAVGGAGAANIDTSVNNLEVKAGTDAFVHNNKAVTVGGVNGVTTKMVATSGTSTSNVPDGDLTGAEATGGNLSLLADGNMTVNETAKAETAGKNVVLETTAGGIDLNADVTAGQNATVLAKTSVNQNAGVTATAGDAYVEAQGGDVTMANGTTTTAGNNARIAASGNVRLSAVNAANSASVKATEGSITDNTTAEAANVTAQKLRLEAGTAVGGAGAANVDTSVNNVEVKAGTDAFVHNDKAVTVGGVGDVTAEKVATSDASTSNVTDADLTGAAAADGNLSLLADGKMTVAEAASASVNAVLQTTADGIELNEVVTAAQNATVTAKTSVDQNANVTATAGDAYVEAEGGDVTMKDGTKTTAGNNARIAASGSVKLSTVNAGNAVSVKATTGSITDNTAAEAANVTAQKLRLEAGTSVGGTGAATVDTSVNNIEIKSGTDAFVHNDKAVTIGGVNGVTTRKVSSSDASTANVTDGDLVGATSAAGNLSVRADGSMTVAEGVSAAASGKNVALETTAGGILVNAAVAAGNDATLRAVDDITVNGTVDAKSTATLEGTGASAKTTLAGSSVVKGSTVTIKNTAVSQAQGGKVQATTLDLQNAGKDTYLASTANEVANAQGSARVLVLEDAADLTVAPGGLTATGNTRLETVSGKNITVNGPVNVTGNATMISAGNLTLNRDVSVNGSASNTLDIEASAGTVQMGSGVTARTAGGNVAVVAKNGDIEIASLDAGNGNVWLEAGGSIRTKNGADETGVSASGMGMSADKIGDVGAGNALQLNLERMSLSGTQGVYVENGKDTIIVTSSQNGSGGAFNVNRVRKDGLTDSVPPGSASASQSRDSAATIDGVVSEKGDAVLTNHGDVTIESGAQIRAERDVTVAADGDIVQETASVTADKKGYLGGLGSGAAGVVGQTVTLDAGGTIGSGSRRTSTPLRVEGSVTATASGTAAVASSGSDLTVSSVSGTDVNVYAPGTIRTGKISASGTLTVTAGDYANGEVVIDAKNLVVNRIDSGHDPQLALFKTQGNKYPKVKNQPNNTIVFIDGRVAGGDIQTINKLGALEAFPVQTPELKSEQGVFGNPFFMHGDMDVSEPVALGLIDFLLVDPAAIRYGAEFPLDADTKVEAAGLSPEFSYRFLGKKQAEQPKPETSPEKESSEDEKDKSE